MQKKNARFVLWVASLVSSYLAGLISFIFSKSGKGPRTILHNKVEGNRNYQKRYPSPTLPFRLSLSGVVAQDPWMNFRGVCDIFFFEVSDLKEVCDSKNVKNHCSTLCWEVGSWGRFPRWRNGVQTYLMSTMWASKGSWRRWRRKGNWEKGDGFRGKYLEGCTIFSWPSPYSGW